MNIFKIFGKSTKRKIKNITLDFLEENPDILEELNNEEIDKLMLSNANKLIQAKHDLKEYEQKKLTLTTYNSSILEEWFQELEDGTLTQAMFDDNCFKYEIANYEYKSVTEIINVLNDVISKFNYVHNMLKQQQTMNNINLKLDAYSCTMAKYDLELTKIKFKKTLTNYDNVFKSRTEQYKKEKEALEFINTESIVDNKDRINYLKSI
jgi:hypothetical protein